MVAAVRRLSPCRASAKRGSVAGPRFTDDTPVGMLPVEHLTSLDRTRRSRLITDPYLLIAYRSRQEQGGGCCLAMISHHGRRRGARYQGTPMSTPACAAAAQAQAI